MAAARLVYHANDEHRDERNCVLRPAAGLKARCAGCGVTELDGATPHLHILYGHDRYEGVCSEACAINAVQRLGLEIAQ